MDKYGTNPCNGDYPGLDDLDMARGLLTGFAAICGIYAALGLLAWGAVMAWRGM